MISKYVSVDRFKQNIYIRGIDSNGKDVAFKKKYKPILFFPIAEQPDGSEFRSMVSGNPLEARQFDSMWDASQAAKEYADFDEHMVYGQTKYEHQALTHDPDLKHSEIVSRSDIRVQVIDIEVSSKKGFPKPAEAKSPVTRIALYDSKDDRYYLFSPVGSWDPSESKLGTLVRQELLDKVVHIPCNSEKHLFEMLAAYWEKRPPHILTGWNSNQFDLAYLWQRQELLDVNLCSLSPFGKTFVQEVRDQFGNPQIEVRALGVSLIDLLDVQKKFNRKQYPFNTLDVVAQGELNRRKFYWENEHGEPMSLQEMEDNPQAYSDYVISDVDLVVGIDQNRKFIDLILSIAGISRVNPENVFSPIPCWDSLIYNYLYKNGRVPHIKSGSSGSKKKFDGAYVKPPQCRRHDWLLSYDLTSLYPSIMMQWNMCPSTIDESASLPYDNYGDELLNRDNREDQWVPESSDHCFAVNGTAFVRADKKKGWLPIVIADVFGRRKDAKGKMLEARSKVQEAKTAKNESEEAEWQAKADAFYVLQDSLKVMLNSLYGACGNRHFRYFDLRIAEGITRSGQLVVQWIEKDVNDYLNKVCGTNGVDYCVGIDTDSNYFRIDGLVRIINEKFGEPENLQKQIDIIDSVAKGIQEKIIEPSAQMLQRVTNCSENFMEMKREAIATAGFWTAKKKYALNVVDSEGVRYSQPEIETKGFEIVKRNTPVIVQNMLKELVRILLQENDPQDSISKFVRECRSQYMSAELNDIAEFTSVSRVDSEVAHSGARSAVLFNSLLQKFDLQNTIEPIQNGDKIKLLALSKPNPFNNANHISYKTEIPSEFGADKYVDRGGMFHKQFISPATRMCEACGVTPEPQETLDSWFD